MTFTAARATRVTADATRGTTAAATASDVVLVSGGFRLLGWKKYAGLVTDMLSMPVRNENGTQTVAMYVSVEVFCV